jgi:hypothetical protein
MTTEARAENAAMLAAALGVQAQEADEALQFDVALTCAASDAVAQAVAREIAAILSRTVRSVELNAAIQTAAIEVIVGNSVPRGAPQTLFVGVERERAVIGGDLISARGADVAPIFTVLIACYASAAVLHRVLGDRLPFSVPAMLIIPFTELGVDARDLRAPIDVGRAHLAGAGAIGNGFLWAARDLDLRGELIIADDDTVSSGNLNRQIWFSADDVGKSKAERLVLHAQPSFANLKLIPQTQRLQDLPERSDGPWLKRLLVAVDSRRARRRLQNEFPGEVFDASTTDIREVVVHYHKQPAANACLSCIYEPDEQEMTREAHIAEHLGVSVDEVRKERISPESAAVISTRFQQLDKRSIVGVAYDTLFKQLCGAQELRSLEGRRVVAPFAFISVLAGTLLALELVRRLGDHRSQTQDNYWRVSPWHPPLSRRRICRPKEPLCEFCGDRLLAGVNRNLWGPKE